MSDIAIRVEKLSKRYRIGLREERPDTLVGAALNCLKAPFTNYRQLRRLSHFSDNGHDPADIIWALRDVSFEVKHGEVIGLIGRNGAGKSTLLKILSRITAPTTGRVVINGRVSSLLEVGTGFHPELTGRENLYLNGTILGMSRREIDRKFDEIVDFSGVEKFIDTPVKRYSSGMKVRLAFAVAAHLEPEILLVDEVLAVGDAEFQKKCLGKMDEVSQAGRTVILVSHNMGAIAQLARHCLWLDNGHIIRQGPAKQVVDTYLSQNFDRSGECFYGDDLARNAQIIRMALRNAWGQVTGLLDSTEPITVEVDFVVRGSTEQMHVGIVIERGGLPVFNGGTFLDPQVPLIWSPGHHRVQMVFPPNILNAGNYTVWTGLAQSDGTKLDMHNHEGLVLQISPGSEAGTRGPGMRPLQGILSIIPDYRVISPVSTTDIRPLLVQTD